MEVASKYRTPGNTPMNAEMVLVKNKRILKSVSMAGDPQEALLEMANILSKKLGVGNKLLTPISPNYS